MSNLHYWCLLALVLVLLAIVYGLGHGLVDLIMRQGQAVFVAKGTVALSAAIESAAIISAAGGTTLQWAVGTLAIVGFAGNSAMARELS